MSDLVSFKTRENHRKSRRVENHCYRTRIERKICGTRALSLVVMCLAAEDNGRSTSMRILHMVDKA